MNNSTVAAIVSGIILMAMTASAKAIIDVAVLKSENKSLKEIVIEIKQDVKDLKNHIIK